MVSKLKEKKLDGQEINLLVDVRMSIKLSTSIHVDSLSE